MLNPPQFLPGSGGFFAYSTTTRSVEREEIAQVVKTFEIHSQLVTPEKKSSLPERKTLALIKGIWESVGMKTQEPAYRLDWVNRLDCVGGPIESAVRYIKSHEQKAHAEFERQMAMIKDDERELMKDVRKLWTPEEIKAAKETK